MFVQPEEEGGAGCCHPRVVREKMEPQGHRERAQGEERRVQQRSFLTDTGKSLSLTVFHQCNRFSERLQNRHAWRCSGFAWDSLV